MKRKVCYMSDKVGTKWGRWLHRLVRASLCEGRRLVGGNPILQCQLINAAVGPPNLYCHDFRREIVACSVLPNDDLTQVWATNPGTGVVCTSVRNVLD